VTPATGLQTWLEEHFAEAVSAQEMARRSGRSQRSLNRRFPAATGSTPVEYLHSETASAIERRTLLGNVELHVEHVKLTVREVSLRRMIVRLTVGSELLSSITPIVAHKASKIVAG